MQSAFTDAISAARSELCIEIATTPAQVEEAQRLRYRVYCVERGFEPGWKGLEGDEFDEVSRHILIRSRSSNDVLATVRVVLSRPNVGVHTVPMQQACASWVLAALPPASTGEISRFALTRDRAGVSNAAGALMRLCLFRGIIQVSAQSGLTHLCTIMEHSLLRLLRATGVHFEPIGPLIEFYGVRQPAVCSISEMLERVRSEMPSVWDYITEDGLLWNPLYTAPLAAATRLYLSQR